VYNLGTGGLSTPGYYYNSGTSTSPNWVRLATTGLNGSGTATQVAFWSGANTLSSNANLYWDNTNGRLGIGTTGPGYKLDVSGDVRLSGDLLYGNGYTRTQTRDDAGAMGGRSGFYETSNPAPAANWPTGASSWWHLLDIRHSNTGNNYAMQFAGSFYDQNLYFRKTNNNAAQPWSQVYTSANGGLVTCNSTNYVIKSDGTNGVCSQIYDNGTNVGIGTTTPAAKLHVAGNIKTNTINETSDARFKKNIQSIDTPLSKVLSLRGVYFYWDLDNPDVQEIDSSKQIGMIAQEVEKILPELVNTDANGYKSVEYSRVVAVLIEAMKEQQKTIDEQKDMINDLNERITKLEELIKVK